ncbi:peptidoglycan D,D-transpeptidase FtsI family protein [Verminephrobacter aporrectodeae]|uniref:peptidoglycan D,D-transpeptidase FtsI family protein n=1 Tax=Verminephrobacter aporrectodeae TaxID=1110389 RepID=UPI0002377AAC|nr:penicillin-binding transpeptidase domain-containing protein [Verminephrobacter aporrectodeae]MCW5256051.1 penicillin-binding protein 2 [Verminephrobacter aporrectodeae subsp. tuberculatae]MCW8176673.1 penicillin-binding protein 2 [Verminephrobacter aporrectodeae subsp. tuberculatae]MCW8204284.1 penicillin-binding protein 2 [Verminephrobacter aporrectodeae subsp. tuberculatae]MCW8206781.1 penicillin-binding protein 2 [Verminephrobacter aporrectodeae subsp. tuberculatae]
MSRSVRYASSPLLASKTPVWRSKFIVALIALGFMGLGARAAYVQVFGNAFFQRQGAVRFARTLELPANRGKILDRNGLILASSVPATSIWAIPEDVDQDAPAVRAKLEELAKLLDMPLAQLHGKLADEDKTFVWIKRQLDWHVGQRIAALGIRGIYQREEYKRQYPEGEAAAHVVGFTNVEDLGQEGVELAFNDLLAGRAGSRRVIKDRLGRVVEGLGEGVPPVDGRDMQLSIDSKVQFFAYQKLRDQVAVHKARAGSVVVLDAHTGELLALANYPSYLPGQRQHLSGEQLRNRALTDVFEPGSTMKPFTIGLALETGRVRPETPIDTNPGRITITGSTISDTHNHGLLTVEGVIQKSSNVGTTKIAMQLPAREMWETFSAAGFGQKPQLRFPGVVSGRLRPYKSWRPVEQATMAYGYGLSASLLQMARSYTVFANGGRVIPATLLKTDVAAVGVPVFSERTADQVRRMLQLAAGPGGTGQKAQTLGYSVGGKSGTARKQEGRNYVSGKYRAWFVGMAPIDAPRIIVAVMIDEPGGGQFYGGAVAAPVFSEVVQQTLRMLGVAPDMAVKPHIVADAEPEPL